MSDLYSRFQRNFEEETVDDLILLNEPDDLTVTEKLRNRYKKNDIYTYIGNTLIAVNPYKKMPLYDSQVKALYHAQQPFELAPHLFSLAEDAYRNMRETGQSQAIIITGESGSGKTESAKYIMDFLSAISISGVVTENIKRIIMESNPVLEAFGNAKTLRNENSSRFSKYVDLFFNFKGQLEGAQIVTSLLEKSRVVLQREGERNFHIFYQLIAGADDLIKKQLSLESPKHFEYLNKTDHNIKGLNDKLEFRKTQRSMMESGISLTEQVEIFRVVAGILHLGNIKFKSIIENNAEGSQIENPDALKKAAGCLGIEEKVLSDCILYRILKVGKEVTKKPQPASKAAYNRDALSKGIYERLFSWLIRRVNGAVKKPDNANQSIGILDIYGFEIYEPKLKNSLEQLNINFVNEKIQYQVQQWQQLEQDEYTEEGIPFEAAKMYDSEPLINIVEGKPIGVYALLDEESLLSGNDFNYLKKLDKNFEEQLPQYEKSKFAGLTFYLKHFAAKVLYDVNEWVEKNRDTLFEDLILGMRDSNSELMKQLFPKSEKIVNAGRLQQTISQQFVQDVNILVGKLKNKRHQYVKCIKPNHSRKPEDFSNEVVMDQVRYLGLCNNIHLRKAGFYFKMPYDKFLSRYRLCSLNTFPRWNGTARAGCEQILKDMGLHGKYALGKTKIFLQSPIQLFALDEKIQSRKSDMASLIQRTYRKFKTKQMFMQNQHLTRVLDSCFGEKGPFVFNDQVNQISMKGERKKVSLIVSHKAIYVLDPKSYCVLRKVPFNKITRLFASNFADNVFVVCVDKEHDLILEPESKSEVMKALRDVMEEEARKNTKAGEVKALQVDIGDIFQFYPRKGVMKSLKFIKNINITNTIIESTPEGLVISVKPSEDVFEGQKLRRKTSFNKKYYGDYIHLQNSDLMKQLNKDFGDTTVHFSAVIGKYNKKYKKQDRILMITERALYNIDPQGYIVQRRIPLRRIKGVKASPLTDNFFVLECPDEYDYLVESNKKTELLKTLSDCYQNATRQTMKFGVKAEFMYKAKKDGTMKKIEFKEDRKVKDTTLQPTEEGCEVLVRVEEVMSNALESEVVQDIYQGQKLRRKESLLKWYMGDYLHMEKSKMMKKIAKKYGDSKLIYSGVVSKINKRYAVQDRTMLITDQAIYNLNKDHSDIKRRIPLKSITGIACSTMKDGFFVVRVEQEYDYFFSSPNKTEIIKGLMDQYKKLYNRNLELNVDDKIVYSPYHFSKGKGVRTIEFKHDPTALQPLIFPSQTGVSISVNNFADGSDFGATGVSADNGMDGQQTGIRDKVESVYNGRKYRRKESLEREYLGDYMRLKENAKIKQLFKQFGDEELLFSSDVSKINKAFKNQKRILLISENAIYNVDPDTFKVKRRIPLDEIDAASLSSMPDNTFCLHMPSSYDYLLSSDKKTEIVDVLSNALNKKQKDLKVNVSDRFEFSPNGTDIMSVSFVLDENTNDAFLEPQGGGLVVHVANEDPAVILECALVHIKDQPTPIEVKPQPILLKLKKKWKYKLEIRFYVNQHLSSCSFHEKIDTVTSRVEYVSQVADLEKREERYVIFLPERRVIYSLLSKTRVKAKLVDAKGQVLLAVRFLYDVK